MMERFFIVTGGAFAFLAVAAGAFGAHALKGKLTTDMLAVFDTAVRYQMAHALAILLTALLASRLAAPWPAWAGGLFTAGILLFSGSLYALVFTGVRAFGAITPLGGMAFLAGWLAILIGALRS